MSCTVRFGLTVSDTRGAMIVLMFLSVAMSTIRCVIIPSNTTVSTPSVC